ncbi:MAG: hypothetical protein J6D06_07895 [Clostridia bacterium]|nr:hypothetical protein [Clostridia bacterium]
MKYCEKCGKEIIDENMGCTECNKPEVELNDESILNEENGLHNDAYFQLIKNAKITNIIGIALLPIAILFAFIFNGFSGAVLCFVAECIALLPKTKVQKKFKKENKSVTDKKQQKAEFKRLNKDLKSKSVSYKMSFIIAIVALALLISSLFGIDALKTVTNKSQTNTQTSYTTQEDSTYYNTTEHTTEKESTTEIKAESTISPTSINNKYPTETELIMEIEKVFEDFDAIFGGAITFSFDKYTGKSANYNILLSGMKIGQMIFESPVSSSNDGYGYVTDLFVSIESTSSMPYTMENVNIVQCIAMLPIYTYAKNWGDFSGDYNSFQKQFMLTNDGAGNWLHELPGYECILLTSKTKVMCISAYGKLQCDLVRSLSPCF